MLTFPIFKWAGGLTEAGGVWPFYGIIDEVRISNTARSSAWLKATYYSVQDNLLTYSGTIETYTLSAASTSYTYEALGRVVAQTNPDNTTISHAYSAAWQDLVTNERGYKKRYFNDAFGRLVRADEISTDNVTVSGNTTYTYDVQPKYWGGAVLDILRYYWFNIVSRNLDISSFSW